ncbi:MAG: hypothetical protein IJL30_07370 [Clostridia bacterium]|nr:hypothetical protein [Clostridia bacterium]
MTTDVYAQYFAAEMTFNGVKRRAASVKLTSDSEAGNIRYTVSVSFFPYTSEDDFAVSYDAYFEKEIFSATGRRSKKREEKFLKDLRDVIDSLAGEAGGKVFWERPLREERRG